jgi:hypothetical protein
MMYKDGMAEMQERLGTVMPRSSGLWYVEDTSQQIS